MGNKESKEYESNSINLVKKYETIFNDWKKNLLTKADIYNLYHKKEFLNDSIFFLMKNKNNQINKEGFLNFYKIILKNINNNKYYEIIYILVVRDYNNIDLNRILNKNEIDNSYNFFKSILDIKEFDKILSNNSDNVSFNAILKKFNDIFNHFVYFLNKFINNIILEFKENIFPNYDKNHASILNEEIVFYLSLYNKTILDSPKLQLLYSTKYNGNSFFQLASKIKGYKKSMIILIKNEFSLMNNDNEGIFGAYSNSEILDVLGYCGDHYSFLFSIKESLKFISTQSGDGNTNYIFMNSKKMKNSKYKTGLGFGGINFQGFRLWIDDDILSKSYIKDEYKTYGRGDLNKSVDDYLNIKVLEIWGLGNEQDLIDQADFKLKNEQEESNNRKIDKAFLLESDFNKKLLLGDNFKHMDEMNTDLKELKK